MINRIIAGIGVILLFSCGKPEIYSEVKEYPDATMQWDKSADFEFKLEDNLNLSSYLYIQHNNTYPFQNIFFFSEVDFPDGHTQRDTLQYMLAKNSGEWLGDGFGASKQMYLHYPINLTQQGEYKIRVWQGMRVDALNGIEKIALSIQENEN